MSTRPVAVKLRIEPDTTVSSPEPPRLELVDPLPEGVRRVDGPERATTALLFAEDAASLRDVLRAHADQLAWPSAFWVAYRKGNRADINPRHALADHRRVRDATDRPGGDRRRLVGTSLPPRP
jgi:hypothetical protein